MREQGDLWLRGVWKSYVKDAGDGLVSVSIADDGSGSGRARFLVPREDVAFSSIRDHSSGGYDVRLGPPGTLVETVRTGSRERVVRTADDIASSFERDYQKGWRRGIRYERDVPVRDLDRGEPVWVRGLPGRCFREAVTDAGMPYVEVRAVLGDGTEAAFPVSGERVFGSGAAQDGFDVFLGYSRDRIAVADAFGAREMVPGDVVPAPEQPEGAGRSVRCPEPPGECWLRGVKSEYVKTGASTAGGCPVVEVSVADPEAPRGRSAFLVDPACAVRHGGTYDVLVGREWDGLAVGRFEGPSERRYAKDVQSAYDPDRQVGRRRGMRYDGRYDNCRTYSLDAVLASAVTELRRPDGGSRYLLEIADPGSPGGRLSTFVDGVRPHEGPDGTLYDVDLGRGSDQARCGRFGVTVGEVFYKYGYEHRGEPPEPAYRAGTGQLCLPAGSLTAVRDGPFADRICVRVPDGTAANGSGFFLAGPDQVSFRDGRAYVDLGALDGPVAHYRSKPAGKARFEEVPMGAWELCERVAASAAPDSGVSVRAEAPPEMAEKLAALRAAGAAARGGQPERGDAARAVAGRNRTFSAPETPGHVVRKDVPEGRAERWAGPAANPDGTWYLRGVRPGHVIAASGPGERQVMVRDESSATKLGSVTVRASDVVPEEGRNTYTVRLGPADREMRYQVLGANGSRRSSDVTVERLCGIYERDCALREAGSCRLDGVPAGRVRVFRPKNGGPELARVTVQDPSSGNGLGSFVTDPRAVHRYGKLCSVELGLKDEAVLGYSVQDASGRFRYGRPSVDRLLSMTARESHYLKHGCVLKGVPPCCVRDVVTDAGRPAKRVYVPDPSSCDGLGSFLVRNKNVEEKDGGYDVRIGGGRVGEYAVKSVGEGGRILSVPVYRTGSQVLGRYVAGRDRLEALVRGSAAMRTGFGDFLETRDGARAGKDGPGDDGFDGR